MEKKILTVSSKRKSVVLLPVSITRTSSDFVMAMTLSKSTIFPADGCQASHLAVLMDSPAQPVDSWVSANDLVLGVDHDDLKELVYGVLAHPV